MALTVGGNTYGTESEFDSYFDVYAAVNPSYAAPSGFDAEAFLIAAYDQMNAFCEWYSTFDPLSPAEPVKKAQFEIVLNMSITGSSSSEAADPLKELKAGSLTLKFEIDSEDKQNAIFTEFVKALLAPYCTFSEPGGDTGSNSGTVVF